MSQDQYSKILNVAARMVTSLQITEDLHDWIISSKIPMKQRHKIKQLASQHNIQLRSAALELRNAIEGK